MLATETDQALCRIGSSTASRHCIQGKPAKRLGSNWSFPLTIRQDFRNTTIKK
jgi:hypothetical protein